MCFLTKIHNKLPQTWCKSLYVCYLISFLQQPFRTDMIISKDEESEAQRGEVTHTHKFPQLVSDKPGLGPGIAGRGPSSFWTKGLII